MPRHRAPLLVATTLLLAMTSPVVSAGGVTERVSISAAGEPANADSYEPSLSGDGRFVVFSSSATNLVPGDTNGKSDVFVRDLKTGTTTLEDPGHVSGNAAITPDGHFLVFGSAAPDVVQGRPRRCQVGVGRSGVAGSWA
jgi:Tol biopolymer transport system component